MKRNSTNYLLGICLIIFLGLFAYINQQPTHSQADNNSAEISKSYWSTKKSKVKSGPEAFMKPDGYIEYYNSISKTRSSDKSSYSPGYRYTELNKANSKKMNFRSAQNLDAKFVARGPGNVGGRTRAIAVDPDDNTNCTWIAGAASGGLWKTTDCGASWSNISSDIPNLSTNSIAQSASNPDVIYVGTGEVFAANSTFVRGEGMYKSTDRGASWSRLESTISRDDFQSVNRIAIDPTDENILLIATNAGVFKSIDGGANWVQKYFPEEGNGSTFRAVQDLQVDPNDYNVQYAGVNGLGIIKSTDAGETWVESSEGITEGVRFEVAIAPTNTNIIYTSTFGSDNLTILYYSKDAGASWFPVEDEDNTNTDYLGGQGWYDNSIAVNPFDATEVFVGGVNIGKFKVDLDLIKESERQFLGLEFNNADFLNFINFGADFGEGVLNISTGNLSPSQNPVTVEIRFGGENVQKAHRFSVPATGGADGDGGAGIPESQYSYEDYIDVPFEVWDVENNRQLMVSFRDQKNDGGFNLNPGDDPNDPNLLNSREYLYIHDIDYNADQANEDVSTTSGGIAFSNMYYFWPVLAPGTEWNPAALQNSSMTILYNSQSVAVAEATAVYDAYGSFGRQNIDNLHPDHHHFTLIPTDASTETFMIVNGNDGGLGISTNNGTKIEQIRNGYITSQFYGADKKPGEDKYIGGTQDNGTWLSTGNTVTDTNSYEFVLGGDGFEVLWHPTEDNLVLGTIYNNRIFKSEEGGINFESSTTGIAENDGPFITRLAGSRTSPNTVFAIGNTGVYRSTDFGSNWSIRLINSDNWGGNSSASDVEVSLANDQIVWAGAGMAEDALNLFVSTNGGRTFEPTNNYTPDPNAFFTGIYTHPTEDSTAYALFSLSNFPKILKTSDLGQTWEDISGFAGSDNGSSKGFPDAFVHSLLVMPFDTDIIWAGTEIGLFESLDGGDSWNIRSDLPPVSVWSMKVVDDQVVIGTHGRGIWTAEIAQLNLSALKVSSFNYLGYGKAEITVDLKSDYDELSINLNNKEVLISESVIKGARTFQIEGVTDFKNPVVEVTARIGELEYEAPKFNAEPIDVAPAILNYSIGEAEGTYPITIELENNEPFDKVEVLFNNVVVHTDEGVIPEEESSRIIEFDYDEQGKNNVQINAYINGDVFTTLGEEQIVTANGEAIENAIAVYPNPVNDQIFIDNAKGDLKQLKIYDANGKFIKAEDIQSKLHSVDVNNLERGVYLFQFVSTEGRISTSRIIKK